MPPERWKKIAELFEAAQQQPADGRAEFLRRACPEDPELGAEVLSMLNVAATGDAFLDAPPAAAPSEGPALAPGDVIGSFEIVGLIGRGGMGEVYRARDPRLQREVAVKTLPLSLAGDEGRLRRFEQEARSASRLNHPNILTIHDVGTASGTAYIVSELVEGGTLQELMARGPLPLDRSLDYALQLAAGLEAAHERGIVHRDIKPANLTVTPGGVLKILDFGLAKLSGPQSGAAGGSSPSDSHALAEEGLILGTAAYMAPEQARLETVDKRADIWAFGLVLWEMLTGRRLFATPSRAGSLAAVLHQPIDFAQLPPGTPEPVRNLLIRCLERDVRKRLRDIGEARVAMEAALQNPRTAPPPVGRQARLAWIAAAALAVCLVALAIYHFREPSVARQRLELQISPPPGILADLALSPDGRFLAIVTNTGSVRTKLWVRSLDNVQARTLGGDGPLEFLATPFWSPDGRFIAAVAGPKLYRIPSSGGPPVHLADLPAPVSGGAWLDTGDIVIAGGEGLHRIPAAGGVPVKLGVKDALEPAPLPGGRYLFARRARSGLPKTDAGIFAGTLDGKPPVRLLADGMAPVYVPPAASGGAGHLLFQRGEALWAQPFDAGRLAIGGEAVVVLSQVARLPWGEYKRSVAVSATGVLVYRGGEYFSTAELTWLDRSGRRLETVSRPFATWENPAIRLSPDETRAIVAADGPERLDLYIADLPRKSFSRFTFHGSNSGIWSPDGKKVLWAAFDGKRYLRAVDGSGSDELLYKNPNCESCFPTDWSSDGTLVAFGERRGRPLEIWLLDVRSRQIYPYVQAEHTVAWGQIAPNGKWMAYVHVQSPRRPQVVVESIPAGGKQWRITTEGGDWPIWRRDGKELFYTWENALMAVPVHESGGLVEFGAPRKLFEFQGVLPRFQASRDGQRFLVAIPTEGSSDRVPLTVDTDWRARLAK